MAGLTLAHDVTGDYGDTRSMTFLTIVPSRGKTDSWQHHVGAVLQAGFAQSGHPQPDEVIEEPKPPTADLWRMVAPGIMVRESEYAARYAHLNLGALKLGLTPEKYRAFVRHIGAIEGRDGVDVSLLVHEESR